MRRHPHIGVLVCLLSIWMQTLVPAAMAAHAAFDPFAVICHHATPDDDGAPAAPIDHTGCAHCLLCHATLAGLAGTRPPALAAPEQHTRIAAGWPSAETEQTRDAAGLAGRPRGPPSAA